uniref:Uncharacterized protein n=1 Tax=Arundo donax TaxID=35708 RepID=A0A0A9C947_ARUDO
MKKNTIEHLTFHHITALA